MPTPILAAVLLVALALSTVHAQERYATSDASTRSTTSTRAGLPASTDSDADSSASTLAKLNLECQSLYQRLEAGAFRVTLPAARPATSAAEKRFDRYPNLNADVKRAIEQRQRAAHDAQSADNGRQSQQGVRLDSEGQNGSSRANGIAGGSQSAPQNGQSDQQAQSIARSAESNTTSNSIYGQSRETTAGAGSSMTIVIPQSDTSLLQSPSPTPTTIGLLVDDRHVLVPVYIDVGKSDAQTIRLTGSDGVGVVGRVVGADTQTQLTVLQLPESPASTPAPPDPPLSRPSAVAAAVRPLTLSKQRLPNGSVVVVVSTIDGVARLALWQDGVADSGVVLNLAGEVAGIARRGQFLSGKACRLIADQLIRHGAVRRATLGVVVTQLDAADGPRQENPSGSEKPVVRVDDVLPNSPAAAAGVQSGDLLLSLAGETIRDIATIAAVIADREGPTPLRVLRNGKVVELSLNLVRK